MMKKNEGQQQPLAEQGIATWSSVLVAAPFPPAASEPVDSPTSEFDSSSAPCDVPSFTSKSPSTSVSGPSSEG